MQHVFKSLIYETPTIEVLYQTRTNNTNVYMGIALNTSIMTIIKNCGKLKV